MPSNFVNQGSDKDDVARWIEDYSNKNKKKQLIFADIIPNLGPMDRSHVAFICCYIA